MIKGMKAVYWCPEDRTALAEAEIEYAEDECDSIYVRFKLTDDPNGVLAKHNIPLDKAWIVIWTTTTWTLPANVATCLNNVGPGLEMVGPMGSFADFSAPAKLLLAFDMLAGRLELYPMLALFAPRLWRKRINAMHEARAK